MFCISYNFRSIFSSLFYWLLIELGFDVSILSARVFNSNNFGPAFDHMLLLVQFPNQQFIADVGFGDSFNEPLKFNENKQDQISGTYQILPDYDEFTIYRSKPNSEPEPQYTFTLKNFHQSDFEEMCDYQQTSENSLFTQKSICTIATEGGRVTISNGRLIITNFVDGSKTKTMIKNETEYRQLLGDYFDIAIPRDLSLEKLIRKAK